MIDEEKKRSLFQHWQLTITIVKSLTHFSTHQINLEWLSLKIRIHWPYPTNFHCKSKRKSSVSSKETRQKLTEILQWRNKCLSLNLHNQPSSNYLCLFLKYDFAFVFFFSRMIITNGWLGPLANPSTTRNHRSLAWYCSPKLYAEHFTIDQSFNDGQWNDSWSNYFIHSSWYWISFETELSSCSQPVRWITMKKLESIVVHSNKTFNSQKIRLLENLVMTWKSQIETAIDYDRDPPKNQSYPFPTVEIEFWTTRAENLRGIQQQVCCWREEH